MQQHNGIMHILEKQRKKKQRRIIRKKILLFAIGAALVIGILLCWFNGITKAQAAEPTEITARSVPGTPLLIGGIEYFISEIEQDPEQTIKTQALNINEDDAYLLAKIAMAEAEGEDTFGKALVILTVLNRVHSELEYFPDTIKDVIFQENAFTPIINGRFNRVEPNEDCYTALALVESGWDESQGSLYFECTTMESTWHSRNLQKLFEHGNQTFYSEEANAE